MYGNSEKWILNIVSLGVCKPWPQLYVEEGR